MRTFRGTRLKEARERLKLTQSELAERVGAGQNQIYRYETGQSEPSTEVLARVASELSITTDWLLGLVDDPGARLQEEGLSQNERALLAAFRRHDLPAALRLLADEPSPDPTS